VRRLRREGFANLLLKDRSQLDLTNQAAVNEFFSDAKPDYVFLAAARVGGILANSTYPAEFLRDNLNIQTNVIDAAHRSDTKKLLFLGSSCIYPKHAPQPMTEDCLLTGSLEPTNEWYAIAKIAGVKMCKAYRSQYGFNAITVMPTNLYGSGDNFDLNNAHVLPALIRKFHEAKLHNRPTVEIWGTGTPRREFLHVDDLADACLFLMQHYDSDQLINVGWGDDVIIKQLAEIVAKVVDYRGALTFDSSKPDGTPRKLLDTTKLTSLGWKPSIELEQGIRDTYEWYERNESN
jgi:GDP-L-fucose synthase